MTIEKLKAEIQRKRKIRDMAFNLFNAADDPTSRAVFQRISERNACAVLFLTQQLQALQPHPICHDEENRGNSAASPLRPEQGTGNGTGDLYDPGSEHREPAEFRHFDGAA